MNYLLECTNVVKNYGHKTALDNLNLNIPKGEIVGLLGPNGAGKTTLIKTIVSLLNYNKGKILIDGKEPSVETKKIVAYLPDNNFLYPWMTIDESISFFKKFFQDFSEKKAFNMIKSMDLDKNQKINSLSKGMKERVNISLTFARKARLFILDEPLAAVDPSTRDKILDIIIDNFDKESSILVSTHIINDVERLFSMVAFISDGKVVLSGNVKELKEKHNKSIENLFKEVI